MKKVFVLMGITVLLLYATDALATVYTVVADAELREEGPDTNRGTLLELGSRVSGTGAAPTQNSLFYLKFNVANISSEELLKNITVRTTYLNKNLTTGRIQNTTTLAYTGFDYYVLDPTLEGANWGEGTITPRNAPGYYLDGNYLTKGVGTPDAPTDGMTYLGRQLFKGTDLVSGHLPVGGAFEFISAPGSVLHAMIETAQYTEHQTVTIAMAIAHDQNCGWGQWVGFNYLFNPKEILTLQVDPASPYSGMSNASGQFSPSLITIPEPATMALLGFGGLALLRKRK